MEKRCDIIATYHNITKIQGKCSNEHLTTSTSISANFVRKGVNTYRYVTMFKTFTNEVSGTGVINGLAPVMRVNYLS